MHIPEKFRFFSVATVTVMFLLVKTIEAARPLTIDDVVPAEKGRFMLEAGVNYVKDSDIHHWEVPATLSYGLVQDLQVGVGTGGQFERREDELGGYDTACSFNDVVLSAKWNPVPQERFGAALALAGGVKLPTADCDHQFGSGHVDCDLTLIATRRWGEKFGTHINFGYTSIGADVDVMHYGIAAEYALTDKLMPVFEVFVETPFNDGSSTSVFCSGGLRYAPSPDFVLDAAIGTNLRGNDPDLFVTVGFTWLFDLWRK
jgi:hypothetical protein